MATTTEIANQLISDLGRDFPELSLGARQGIVGALAMESGGFKQLQELAPLVPGSKGGYGFAQWTGPRRKAFESYAEKNKLDPSSYEANYGYLREELRGVGGHDFGIVKKLRKVTDPHEAQRIFTGSAESRSGFLRPGIVHEDHRTEWTRQVVAGYVQVPGAEIPNVVASELDTADLTRMAPRPASTAQRDAARAKVASGGGSESAETFQLERAVPLPKRRPEDPPQLEPVVTGKVTQGVLLPALPRFVERDVERPRPRPEHETSTIEDSTMQLERAVPPPRRRPADPEQLQPVVTGKVTTGTLLPALPRFVERDVPLPRRDARQVNRMDLAADDAASESLTLQAPVTKNVMSREDTGQARNRRTAQSGGMSQRVLTDSEVAQALAPMSQMNPAVTKQFTDKAPTPVIEQGILKSAGTHGIPLISGMDMPEIGRLGKFAPKITDLDNIAAEQAKLRQRESEVAATGKKALEAQNTIAAPDAADGGKKKSPIESVGDSLLEGLRSLFGIEESTKDTATSSQRSTSSSSRSSSQSSSSSSGSSGASSGSSSSSSSSSGPEYTGRSGTFNGRVVHEQVVSSYNPDTNQFEKTTRYK